MSYLIILQEMWVNDDSPAVAKVIGDVHCNLNHHSMTRMIPELVSSISKFLITPREDFVVGFQITCRSPDYFSKGLWVESGLNP
ncbi:hypothetical protein TNCV_4446941 [Trichonephila clavipes]|nr:hypothetical protein TNCV_4446941 [Trichonephila clavipes]